MCFGCRQHFVFRGIIGDFNGSSKFAHDLNGNLDFIVDEGVRVPVGPGLFRLMSDCGPTFAKALRRCGVHKGTESEQKLPHPLGWVDDSYTR